MHYSASLLNIVICIYLVINAPKYGKSPVLWGVLGFCFGALPMSIFSFKTNRPVSGAIWLTVFIIQVVLVVIAIVALVALSAACGAAGGC